MAKANAETGTTALLFSFSAVVVVLLARTVLLQPPDRSPGGALADLLLAAANGLDRFLDGRGLLDLATRRNMVLLCHAILLVILRDAGIIGAPARRRAATAAPALTHAAEPERSIVVWQWPWGSAKDDAHADGSGRRLVRRRQPRQSAQQYPAAAAAPIPCAAPALAEQPEQHQPPLTTKGVVLVEEAPRNYLLDDHDRAGAVVDLHLTSASEADGKKSGFDRRILVACDERDVDTAAEETPELADDRRIEEFIAMQWSKMRQEMQLEMSSSGSAEQSKSSPSLLSVDAGVNRDAELLKKEKKKERSIT